MTTAQIELYAGDHAIEYEVFAIVFRSHIDSGDEARFEEHRKSLEELFGAIDTPDFIELSFGSKPAPRTVMRQLSDFGRDGTPIWNAQFGENAIALTCRRYTGWEKVWPDVVERLSLLLSCIDPFKPVRSIEYTVTDNLRQRMREEGKTDLLAKNIFRSGASLVPPWLLHYDDPRWDFQSGRFIEHTDAAETLERLEAKSVLAHPSIVTTITNTISFRYKNTTRVKELFSNATISAALADTFSRFHDKNKETVRDVLVDDLLTRMGL